MSFFYPVCNFRKFISLDLAMSRVKELIPYCLVTVFVFGIVGIISDAAVVTLVMSFISWAIKQERLLEESSLEIPSQWLQ